MLRSNQRNSMGFYSSLVVDVCKIALFPSLKNASQLVASSPNFGQVAQESDSVQISQLFFSATSRGRCTSRRCYNVEATSRRRYPIEATSRKRYKFTLREGATSRKCYNVEATSRESYTSRRCYNVEATSRRRYPVEATSRKRYKFTLREGATSRKCYNVVSIFTGSCFACGISLPLCFIIAQVPKQKKTHGTQFFQIDAAGLFSPLCAVHCFWCMRVLC